MKNPKLVKTIGTVLAFLAGSGSAIVPEKYRPITIGVATLLLGWLHLPQPGSAAS